jgi:cell division protein FtsI (penicillin-binding protein 3)
VEYEPTHRIKWLARVIFGWAGLVVLRLLYLQGFQHEQLTALADSQQEKLIDIAGPRGTILDRTGDVLAMSVPVESVCVNPFRVPDPAVAADILAGILKLDADKLAFEIRVAVSRQRGFLWIKRKVTAEEATRLRNLNLDWVEFRTESKRQYVSNSLAAHVLGGVDFEEKGNAGIEQMLEEQLQGRAGAMHVVTDVKQRGYESRLTTESSPGKTLRLTILARLQYIAEQELKKSVEAHNCKTGSLVVMDPKTGEILALANYPTYNPNELPQPGDDLGDREDQAVTAPFEPGSVFKVITISAALETTSLRPETVVSCGNGSITIAGRTIHDHNSYSALPVEDVLARSSNIGAINIGLKVGDRNMFDYVHRFGFAKRIGVPLPGESPGLLRPLKLWQKSSIGSVAMGHEVSVTTLQLARACSVIANGGYLVKPNLVLGEKLEAPQRVIRPETAITMRHMMEGVIFKPYGTGYHYARIPGYSAGGKTGTAQIYDFKAHVYTHHYNSSFMGFAPLKDPAVVVVVSINGATGQAGYGGPVSGPVFREVAAAALRLLEVPKDMPDVPLPNSDGVKADDNDLAIADLVSSDPQPPLAGNASGQRSFSDSQSQADASTGDLVGPKAPNFQGMTKRDVLEESAALGIPVEFSGNGLVRSQEPPPGAVVPIGERVRLRFGN